MKVFEECHTQWDVNDPFLLRGLLSICEVHLSAKSNISR